jgi:hypothetical protein
MDHPSGTWGGRCSAPKHPLEGEGSPIAGETRVVYTWTQADIMSYFIHA